MKTPLETNRIKQHPLKHKSLIAFVSGQYEGIKVALKKIRSAITNLSLPLNVHNFKKRQIALLLMAALASCSKDSGGEVDPPTTITPEPTKTLVTDVDAFVEENKKLLDGLENQIILTHSHQDSVTVNDLYGDGDADIDVATFFPHQKFVELYENYHQTELSGEEVEAAKTKFEQMLQQFTGETVQVAPAIASDGAELERYQYYVKHVASSNDDKVVINLWDQ